MRTRYHLAGKTTAAMLERPGVPTQQLRGYAALFLEWFRICLRHGWIGSWAKINESSPVAITSKGLKKLQQMLRERRKACLHLPYGKAAVRLGIAPNERAGPFNILLVLGQDGQAAS